MIKLNPEQLELLKIISESVAKCRRLASIAGKADFKILASSLVNCADHLQNGIDNQRRAFREDSLLQDQAKATADAIVRRYGDPD